MPETNAEKQDTVVSTARVPYPERIRALLQLQTVSKLQIRTLAIVALLLLLGLDLRIQSALHTEVDTPIRADARDYYFYAYNLNRYGTYSRSLPRLVYENTPPKPDAVRSPGYPLFLALFIHEMPTREVVRQISISQAILSVITIAFAYLLYRQFLPSTLSIAATALTALSPHLTIVNVYLLSEPLFSFLLILLFLLLTKIALSRNTWVPLAIGAILGLASLTRPSLQYFIVPLGVYLFYYFRNSNWRRLVIVITMSFLAVFGSWITRNVYTLGITSNKTLAINAIHHGMYPGFMYEEDAESFGYPYRADPRSAEISRDLPAVLGEVARRFKEEPLRHLKWYILDKPRVFWSWNIVQGMGDAFIYPVVTTPYAYLPHFKMSHHLMRWLHWPLVIFGLLGCVVAWLPRNLTGLNRTSAFIAQALSMLLIYYTLIHIIVAPFPRYSIPLRPFLYGAAMLPLLALWHNRSIMQVRWKTSPDRST